MPHESELRRGASRSGPSSDAGSGSAILERSASADDHDNVSACGREERALIGPASSVHGRWAVSLAERTLG